jgi:hypothetical protein
MPRPGIPEKAIKILSARNKRDLKKKNKKKQDLAKRIGGSHHDPVHYVHGYLAV